MDAQSKKPESGLPTVAVVMATFNRADLISDAIDSILNQTRAPDEFIVVNDGSTDDTAGVVRRYGGRIKYLEKPNGGKAAALNLALSHVDSTHAWVFDDDDIALPNALEAHLGFLSQHPDCDFSYSTHYLFSGGFSDETLHHARLRRLAPVADADYFFWIMESAFFPYMMQGMLIPTRCYRAVGGFDEAMLRGQDWDIMLRIARHFRAGFLDQPTFALRTHGGARGPISERHAEADRQGIWTRYERRTFEKLRVEASLGDYLPGRAVACAEQRPLSATERRQALLRRAMVMAVHGLFATAADDFRAYVGQLGRDRSGLTETEQRHISTLAYVQNPETVPPSGYYRELGALIRGRRELLRPVLRGLYWSIAREIRRRHFALAAHLVGLGANLACACAGLPTKGRRWRREFT